MAKEPAAEESARRILDLFVNNFHLRAGGTLFLSDFLGKFENDGFRNLHFPDGMQFAINNGWVEPNRLYRDLHFRRKEETRTLSFTSDDGPPSPE